MRIFVTGASGWIGSAVVPELLGAGHEVIGLARSDVSAAALTAAGVEAIPGTLDDLDQLKETAASSDGVIHLAFKHDIAFTGDFDGAANADRLAIETFADALAGSDKPFVIASGLLGVKPGAIVTERDGHDGAGFSGGPAIRLGNAELTLSLSDRGVRSSVLRLPPTVHGDGDNGFMATIINIARTKGVSAYIGDGLNMWPAVHRLDAAKLFRLGLEKAPGGSTLHAIGDEGVKIRDIAEVIGQSLGLPVQSVTQDEAGEHFGFLAHFLGLNSPASATFTNELLGFTPENVGLIEDLQQGHYFAK